MKALNLLAAGFALLVVLALSGCSGGVTETGNPSRSYVTSSTDGFGTWEVSDSSFRADWSITSASGAVQYTYRLVGGCGAPGTFGFRPCAIVAVQCEAAASGCSGTPVAGELFYLLEASGVSFLVYIPSKNVTMAGIVKGDCTSNLAGEYTTMPTGAVLPTYFGMYRADASFTNLVGSSFSLVTPTTPTLYYATTSGAGTGAVTLGASTCSDGIREFTLEGVPVRATTTAGGLWSFSLPAGLGGGISFKTSLAAQTSDLANKTFYGFIGSPVAGTAAMVRLETGASSGTLVPYRRLVFSNVGDVPVSGQYVVSAKDAGSLYGLDGNPPGANGTTYADNFLQPDYPTPGDIPGLFVSNGAFVTAMKSNGKVILLGISFSGSQDSVVPITSSVLFEQ